jgi:plastocyanin
MSYIQLLQELATVVALYNTAGLIIPPCIEEVPAMRKPIYLAALALVLIVVMAPSAGATGTTTTVSIQDFFFSPADVSVPAGTTVTWVNEGNVPHTVTSDDGQFDSGVHVQGEGDDNLLLRDTPLHEGQRYRRHARDGWRRWRAADGSPADGWRRWSPADDDA